MEAVDGAIERLAPLRLTSLRVVLDALDDLLSAVEPGAWVVPSVPHGQRAVGANRNQAIARLTQLVRLVVADLVEDIRLT